jgi:hypothetical protein
MIGLLFANGWVCFPGFAWPTLVRGRCGCVAPLQDDLPRNLSRPLTPSAVPPAPKRELSACRLDKVTFAPSSTNDMRANGRTFQEGGIVLESTEWMLENNRKDTEIPHVGYRRCPETSPILELKQGESDSVTQGMLPRVSKQRTEIIVSGAVGSS